MTSTPDSSHQHGGVGVRALWSQVYLPNMILATGQGAMLPVLALVARGEGASTWVAGVIVAVNGLGTAIFDIPSGSIVARVGETLAGWIAAGFLVVGLVGAILTHHSVILLGFFVFIAACGWSVWSVVRLTHLSRVALPEARGRALSVFGGVTRAGQVIGPFIVVGVAGGTTGAHAAFVIYLIAVLIGFAFVAGTRDRSDEVAIQTGHQRLHPVRVITDNKREFATAGVGTFEISLLRGSRQALIPLWGAHIGLDASQVSLIYGISSIVDLSLFYPSGLVSDRYGRKAVALPCILILAAGHFLLPFTHAFITLLLAALVLGGGNGLGSGIVMSLGADRAPDIGRASFLGVWRSVSDAGTAAGPLIDAAVIGIASLALAGPVVGFTGIGAAYVVLKWMNDPVIAGGARGT